MIKLVLKLAVVALLANATWQLFSAYSAHYRFVDAVESSTQFGSKQSDDQMRERVLELAMQYDVPVTEDTFTLLRQDKHTTIDGSYTRPVDLFPGVVYPWPFTWHVDTFTLPAP